MPLLKYALALLLALTHGCSQHSPSPSPSTEQTQEAEWTQHPPPPTVLIPRTLPTPAPHCQEDEPCWDCRTMGNLTCGVETSVSIPGE